MSFLSASPVTYIRNSKIESLFRKITDELFRVETLAFLAFLMASLFVFSTYKKAILQQLHTVENLFLFIPPILIAIAGTKIKVNEFPASLQIILRTILLLFGAYILMSYPTMPVNALPDEIGFIVEYGRFMAAAACVAGCFFLSWGLIPLTFIIWYKAVQADVLGLEISHTDYLPLIEIAIFFILSFLLLKAIEHITPKIFTPDETDESQLTSAEKIVLFGIAAHMANYFYSGVKKIHLGDSPLSWVLENQTQSLLINARELGQLPIGFSDTLSAFMFETLGSLVVLNNALLLAGQLFALIALCRVRWALWATLFYDLTHIVIFIVSGIFFYKWILFNTSIVFALETMKKKAISPLFAIVFSLAVFYAPSNFFVAHLGWWDTPALNAERFYAITEQGETIPIPTNYWGIFSVRFAQQRIIWDKENGYFPTGTYGITQSYDEMIDGFQSCDDGFIKNNGTTDAIERHFETQPSKLEDFVRQYHDWVLSRDKKWSYNLYPHHIFSFPWTYAEFRKLDPKDIVAYRYHVSAVCLGHTNDGFARNVVKEGWHDISVR